MRERRSRITQALHPGFCNGPWFVNPSFQFWRAFGLSDPSFRLRGILSPGDLLLYGVGAPGCGGRHLMGFGEDEVGQSTCAWLDHYPDGGLT
jgi:hypothetical protein